MRIVRVHQVMDVDDEIAHLRLVHRALGLGGPGGARLGEVGIDADNIEPGEILERDRLGGDQFAAEHQMQKLLGIVHDPVRSC
jgi:hypothetical protein